MNLKLRSFFLFILFLIGTSFASNWYDSVYVWLGIAIIMASAVLGLAYMLGSLLEVQILSAWVKVELKELVNTAVFAVFCIGLIASVDLASSWLTGTNNGAIDAAKNFLKNELYEDGRALYHKAVETYFNVAKLSGYSYTASSSLYILSIGFSIAPYSGISPLVAQLGQATDTAVSFMLLVASQWSFVTFFESASLILLPVGIFLRAFGVTRKLGALLMGSTIAVGVIYPASILVSKEIYQNFKDDLKNTISQINVPPPPKYPLNSIVCNQIVSHVIESPLAPVLGGEEGWSFLACLAFPLLCAALHTIITIAFILARAGFSIAISLYLMSSGKWGYDTIQSNYVNNIHDYLLPAVAKFSVLSIVTFLIPIIITIVMVRQLVLLFGGEPQLYGLSKII